MAVNLVELAKGYLTPDIMQKAASFVGESEPATQKAVSGIVPTLIAAMANLTSTTGGAEKLTRILDTRQVRRQRAQQPGIPVLRRRDDTESHHPRQGYSKLSVRQQDRGPGGSDRALRRSSTGSASSLLASIVPLILSLLGRQRATIGQSPSALAALLGEQKGFLSALLPAGIGSFLGWTGYETARPREAAAYVEPKRET